MIAVWIFRWRSLGDVHYYISWSNKWLLNPFMIICWFPSYNEQVKCQFDLSIHYSWWKFCAALFVVRNLFWCGRIMTVTFCWHCDISAWWRFRIYLYYIFIQQGWIEYPFVVDEMNITVMSYNCVFYSFIFYGIGFQLKRNRTTLY